MAVTIPANGWTSIASTLSTETTQSIPVPSGAVAGDVLLIHGIAERTEIPVVRLNGTTSGLTTLRSETSGPNLSTLLCWKRLTSADLNGTIGIFNTLARRQALAAIVIRGSIDPVVNNHPFSTWTTATAKTPPNYFPGQSNSLAVSTWSIARVFSPYTGYTFSASSPWTERVETSGSWTGNIEPTVYIATNLLGANTGGVSQTNLTLSSTTDSWDSMTSTTLFAPSGSGNPVARASVIQPIAEINCTASTATSGGLLSYSISPSTGVTQPSPGIFLVPYTNSPQTFTVTVSEAGGGTSTVQASVPASPSSGSITNTTGVETVRFHSGAWI